MNPLSKIFSKTNCIHPNSFFIRLTNECNQNCPFCNVHGSFENISTEDAKKEIDTICQTSKGCVIQFTGGEPTLREDLAELIKYAKEKGASTLIQTNAVLLSDREYLKKLTFVGLDKCIVSFHSEKKDISEKLSQAKNFEKNIQGINNLLKENIKVLINILITKLNYENLPETTEYVISKFDKIQGIIFSTAQPHGKAHMNQDLVPKMEMILPPLKKSIWVCTEKSMNFHISYCENPLCFILCLDDKTKEYESKEIAAKITENGCSNCHLVCEMKNEKTKFSFCENCVLNSSCDGVWKNYVEMYGEKEFLDFKLKNKL